jgi:threonine/homoserine/homoserine lactone efflux protein
MSLIAKAIAIGFSVASPGDTIGFICIQQTLKRGIRAGIAASLGAATADMMYGILVIFSLRAAQVVLLSYKTHLTIIDGLFLCGLGVREFFFNPSLANSHPIHRGLLSAYGVTLFLTLINSSTILEITALFTELNIILSGSVELVTFIGGLFIGSALWWLLLCFSAEFFRRKMSEHILQYINRIAGVVIFAFGLYAFSKLWQ